MLNQLVARMQLDRRVHVHLYLSFFVNDPLAKVPWKLKDLAWRFSRLELFCVATEPFEHIVCVWSIDVAFVHQWKTHAKFSCGHSLNIFVLCFFLAQELAARKANHCKAVLLVPIVQLHELFIVPLGEGSLGGNVHNKSASLALHVVAEHRFIEVDVSDQDGPQLADYLALTSVLTRFPRRTEADASLSIAHLVASFFSLLTRSLALFNGLK